ncbi:hypothetical protein RF11_13676 [Thelohanellus kitauei]|uniref:Uncharacterized protein n=1 Tax=Thelohanellus kitauei TaxID=669202 RepID=A0A0C2IZJ4_THEKT|nr:hypothetical protein RF11_13676 [Thelohanellus kitauei]
MNFSEHSLAEIRFCYFAGETNLSTLPIIVGRPFIQMPAQSLQANLKEYKFDGEDQISLVLLLFLEITAAKRVLYNSYTYNKPPNRRNRALTNVGSLIDLNFIKIPTHYF